LYFHERAIERRRRHNNPQDLLADELFLEYVYAVLPAWGMHRMGAQAAKVDDFSSIVGRLRSTRIIWSSFGTCVSRRSPPTRSMVWRQRHGPSSRGSGSARLGPKSSRGARRLHHLLPDLIPPTRQYTFRFFTGQGAVSSDREAFLTWLPLLAIVGKRCRDEIESAIKRRGFMATSEAKVIDNAIMGFMQASKGRSSA
jgi:hypothetical protein